MPTPTYDLLASNVLSSSASSVTFSSIPATYRDLVVVGSYVTGHAGSNSVYLRLNGDTGSNYNRVIMVVDGTSILSFAGTVSFMPFSSLGVSVATNAIAQIFDYATTDKHKTALIRDNVVDTFVRASAQRWANTAAITSITLEPTANQFIAGDSFQLYGIVS